MEDGATMVFKVSLLLVTVFNLWFCRLVLIRFMFFWWLVESHLSDSFCLFAQIFRKVVGPTNSSLSAFEYILSSQYTNRWWGFSKLNCYNWIRLIFLQSEVVGVLKYCSHILILLHLTSHPGCCPIMLFNVDASCLQVPPPSIDFVLPSPTIGLPLQSVVDPPWMPRFKAKVTVLSQEENVSLEPSPYP